MYLKMKFKSLKYVAVVGVGLILSSYVDPAVITLKVQPVISNLQAPTAMAFPGNGTIWIAEQTGKIRVFKNGKLSDVPLLDVGSKLPKLNNGYEERGLLGIALHPKFKVNRKFYVFYSMPTEGKFNHKDVVAEYTVAANGAEVEQRSGRIIISADKPDGNHNGGAVQFGPDGYLYISFGDGGGQGDKHGEIGNGQSLNTLLGKILRIDVNSDSAYQIPKDNPFVNQPGAKGEIWAYGFRNPYRISFDKTSGQLFVGDVGQDTWEEVDIIRKGGNYGWRMMEGNHCYNPETGCEIKGVIKPIAEYNHREGVSITGGYVYNGKTIPVLKGKYFFADWTGPTFYLKRVGENWQRGKVVLKNLPLGMKITGFGEDATGELYMLTNPDTGPGNKMGSIYKISKN
jgi:glucose/arabinose dehydrogenase